MAKVIDLEQMIRDIVREELAKAKPANDDNAHMTVAAFARRLAISERTVRDAIRENRLAHVRIGRSVRIPTDAKIEPRIDAVTARARLSLFGGGKR